MSFTTRLRSILIAPGTVFTDTPTLVDESADLTEEGFDTLTLTYAMRRAALTAEHCAALFPQGSQIGSRKFWIVSARPQRVAAGFWLAEVVCKGWASNKPAKVRVGAGAETQSGKNVIAPTVPNPISPADFEVFAAVQTRENTPTVSVSFLAEDLNTYAQTHLVGRAVSLPAGISVAVAYSIWSTLSTYTYHWPNGWVLMASEQDRIPGTDAGFVTNSYLYVRPITPS